MHDAAYLIFGFGSALAWSTVIIRLGIPRLADPYAEQVTAAPQVGDRARPPFFKTTGFWIGFFESVLIFLLVFLGEFAALALIEGFKQNVRQRQQSAGSDAATRMFLAFLTNLTVAVCFAFWTKQMVSAEFLASLR